MAKTNIKRAQIQRVKNYFHAYEDCITNINSSFFQFLQAGTGAGFGGISLSTNNACGICTMTSGSTATGRCSIGSSNSLAIMRAGLGKLTFTTRFYIGTLSNGTDRYVLRMGFLDSFSGESVDFIGFRYSDDLNSGKFQCVTRSNSSETATDSGITLAVNTWYTLEVVVNADGTSCEFFIDGASVGTITTNIPSNSSRLFSYGFYAQKTVGTTNITMAYIDYLEVLLEFTTPR